jgi:two-component system, chemotaxis family, response regulator Rcp1
LVHSRSETKRLPDLILLDLNMPRKNGRQALLEIKSDPAFQNIPVVILTTSEKKVVDPITKAECNSFITKPSDFDEWVEIMKSLAERWLRDLEITKIPFIMPPDFNLRRR